MLITNGDFMWGTVFDDINKKALQLKIGDCLTFGNFIPDGECRKTDIRVPMIWHVIDKKWKRLKLLSYFFFEYRDYCTLDSKFLSTDWKATWKETAIRHYLNNEYFYKCFSESERNAILTTEVKTKADSSGYIITKDKLYVPALDEITAIPEHLKIGRGLYTESSDDGIPSLRLLYCYYWLRDPGEDENENLMVQGYVNSKIVIDSERHDADQVGVRVVMWVDAEKIRA